MYKLLVLIFVVPFACVAQPLVQTTPFTRDFLTSTNAGQAVAKLGVSGGSSSAIGTFTVSGSDTNPPSIIYNQDGSIVQIQSRFAGQSFTTAAVLSDITNVFAEVQLDAGAGINVLAFYVPYIATSGQILATNGLTVGGHGEFTLPEGFVVYPAYQNSSLLLSRPDSGHYSSFDFVTAGDISTGFSFQLQPDSPDFYILDRATGLAAFHIYQSSLDVGLSGNLKLENPGTGLVLNEDTSWGNAKSGSVTLVAGTATISTTAVTTSSRIYLTVQDPNGSVPGNLYIATRNEGSDFTIQSSNVTDTSVVAWMIVQPI